MGTLTILAKNPPANVKYWSPVVWYDGYGVTPIEGGVTPIDQLAVFIDVVISFWEDGSPVSLNLRFYGYDVPNQMPTYVVGYSMGVNPPMPVYPAAGFVPKDNHEYVFNFSTNTVDDVTEAPPPPALPVAAISSLTASPSKVKPGEKVTVTAQLTVSTTFKGMMKFDLWALPTAISATLGIKDWLAGSYGVSVEITVPQGTQAGTYQGLWVVVDTVANKQLASKDIQVEVVAPGPTPTPAPTPAPTTTDWLTSMMPVLTLMLVGAMATQLPKLLSKVFGRK